MAAQKQIPKEAAVKEEAPKVIEPKALSKEEQALLSVSEREVQLNKELKKLRKQIKVEDFSKQELIEISIKVFGGHIAFDMSDKPYLKNELNMKIKAVGSASAEVRLLKEIAAAQESKENARKALKAIKRK